MYLQFAKKIIEIDLKIKTLLNTKIGPNFVFPVNFA